MLNNSYVKACILPSTLMPFSNHLITSLVKLVNIVLSAWHIDLCALMKLEYLEKSIYSTLHIQELKCVS